jgi:hypothetical protein
MFTRLAENFNCADREIADAKLERGLFSALAAPSTSVV